jgi:hypothetical protein
VVFLRPVECRGRFDPHVVVGGRRQRRLVVSRLTPAAAAATAAPPLLPLATLPYPSKVRYMPTTMGAQTPR